MDRKALWFAVGVGCTGGLGLDAIVLISNLVQGTPTATLLYLIVAAVPLAYLAGYGLGRGRD